MLELRALHVLLRQSGAHLARSVFTLSLAVSVAHEEQIARVSMLEALADTCGNKEAVLQELVFDGGHMAGRNQFLK